MYEKRMLMVYTYTIEDWLSHVRIHFNLQSTSFISSISQLFHLLRPLPQVPIPFITLQHPRRLHHPLQLPPFFIQLSEKIDLKLPDTLLPLQLSRNKVPIRDPIPLTQEIEDFDCSCLGYGVEVCDVFHEIAVSACVAVRDLDVGGAKYRLMTDSVSEGSPKMTSLKAAAKKARSPMPGLVVLEDLEDIVGAM